MQRRAAQGDHDRRAAMASRARGMTSRLPSSLAILQAVHEAGGETPYDIGAISARLGLPKMSARRSAGASTVNCS